MTRCYEESRAFVSSLRLDDRDERMRDNCLFWDICPSELVGRYLEGRERGGGGVGGAIDCTVVFRPRAIVFFKLDVFI